MPRRVLAIDVGTHTVLAAVGRAVDGRLEVLADRQWFARLGQGVRATGRLRPEAIARGVSALRQARAMTEARGAVAVAVATRACREAANVAEFLAPAAEALGAPVEVIDGTVEAELTFRGAASGLGVAGAATYADVGGGSTELIVAEGLRMIDAVSTPLGVVALTEAHLRADPHEPAELARVRERARAEIARAGLSLGGTVVGIGGTATTFVAVERGLSAYDGSLVHGYRVTRAVLGDRVARLAALPLAERSRVTGLAAERAPVIVAGGIVLEELLEAAGAAELVVSDRGVRHGLLLDRLGLPG